MSNKLFYGLIIVLIAGAFAFGRSSVSPEVVTIPVEGQVDEDEWVSRASFVKQKSIADSLSQTVNKVLENKESELRSYSQLNARLKLEKDSLQSELESFRPEIVKGEIQDTSYTRQETYTDSLFTVTGTAEFVSGEIFLYLDLKQNRNINVDITEVATGRDVVVFVKSPDFEELNVKSYHTFEPPTYRWYHWMLLGAGVATATYITIDTL